MAKKQFSCLDPFIPSVGLATNSYSETFASHLGKVVFFPNDTAEIKTLMQRVDGALSARYPGDEIIETFVQEYDEMLLSQEDAKRCYGDRKSLNFRTKKDAMQHVRFSQMRHPYFMKQCTSIPPNTKKRVKYFYWKHPLVTSIVDLTGYTSQNPKYKIVSMGSVEYGPTAGELATMALLDEAIMNTNDSLPVSEFLTLHPTDCYKHITGEKGTFVMIVLMAILVIFPWYGLDIAKQITSEKQGQLKSFLDTLGVKGFMVNISWSLFFFLFAAFFSFGTAVAIKLLVKVVAFGTLLVTFLLYNIAQCAFMMLLVALLGHRTKRLTSLYVVILILGSVVVYLLTDNPQTHKGDKLPVIYALFLFYPTPYMMVVKYMGQRMKLGLESDGDLGKSYYQWDETGGIRMCLVFLATDAVVYIFMSFLVEALYGGNILAKFRHLRHSKAAVKSEHPVDGDMQEGTIKLCGITKKFGDVLALNDVSVQFPGYQVTAFLGENGAGKSTTANIMTGFLSATSGSVTYDNRDLTTNFETIMAELSYLPQHDILYDYLSLLEHIKFYGWLKGLSSTEINTATESLNLYDLKGAENVPGTRLSGGQKRKLGIFVAYLGGPRYVILDEPTSGVDVFSARTIWDVMLRHKGSATTILSTHRIEDAEVLADNVAIIDKGEIRAVGTPLELKEQLGLGFSLIMDTSKLSSEDFQQAKSIVVDGIELDESQITQEKRSATFKINQDVGGSDAFLACIKNLENAFETFGHGSYGVSDATLGDVYQETLNRHHGTIKAQDMTFCSEVYQNWRNNLIRKNPFVAFGAIMYRRLLFALDAKFTLLYFIVLPMILTTFTGYMKEMSTGAEGPLVSGPVLSNPIPQSSWLYLFAEDTSSMSGLTRSECQFLNNTLDDGVETFVARLPGRKKLSACSCGKSGTKQCTPISANVDGSSMLQKLFGARHGLSDDEFDQRKNVSQHLEALYSTNKPNRPVDGVIVSSPNKNISSVNLLLLRKGREAFAMATLLDAVAAGLDMPTITRSIEYGTVNYKGVNLSNLMNLVVIYLLGLIFFLFAFPIVLSQIRHFVSLDYDSGTKHLIDLAGASPLLYWLSNLISDTLLLAPVLTLMLLITEKWLPLLNVDLLPLYPFGLVMAIPYAYAVTHSGWHFLASSGLDNAMVMTGFFAGFIAYIGDNILSYICFYSGLLLRINPAFFIGETFAMVLAAYFQEMSMKDDVDFGFHHKVAIATACVCFCVYGALLLVSEYFGMKVFFRQRKSLVPPQQVFDEDVANEAADARQTLSSHTSGLPTAATATSHQHQEGLEPQQPAPMPPLLALGLTKVYDKSKPPAVFDVAFSVKHEECFGLLGVNGAGKSTTFRMLTGLIAPDEGECYLEGVPYSKKPRRVYGKMMYCPQEDTLCEYLTVSQHVDFYAKLAGFPTDVSHRLQGIYKDALDVSKYNNRKVGNLSGGNKRKVQLIASVIGCPRLAFLDEPTTGLDPTARQQAWNVIGTIKKNASVILTSHSLDDCEALCDRLVIMVAGQFRCIGSIQYLKHKLGNKFTFRLKVKSESQAGVEMFIGEKLHEKAKLVDRMPNWLVFEIDSDDLGKISRLYGILKKARSKFDIESATVSQITLQDVFFRMAREAEEMAHMQEMMASGQQPQLLVLQEVPPGNA